MAAIPCDACGGKMNHELVVCPHCGARRQVTAPPKLSGDEIRALLVSTPGTVGDEPRGMFQTLVLPHPATSGRTRLIELALTVVSLPLVVAGAIAVGVSLRLRHRSVVGGELVPALTMTVFGGFGLIGHLPLVLIGVPVAALWTRALLRWRVSGARRVDLQRIERPAPEPRPALPAARSVRVEPPATPQPEPPGPATDLGAGPAAEPATEPRLLR